MIRIELLIFFEPLDLYKLCFVSKRMKSIVDPGSGNKATHLARVAAATVLNNPNLDIKEIDSYFNHQIRELKDFIFVHREIK